MSENGNMRTRNPNCDYFGQVAKVNLRSGESTVTLKLTAQQAQELGRLLIAAGVQSEVAERRTRRNSHHRNMSNLAETNEIRATWHRSSGQVTVLSVLNQSMENLP